MILIIDNVDSFVHNLARYFRLAGMKTHVVRHDAISVANCLAIKPDGVVISPGPKRPVDAGISLDLIKALPLEVPYLGVCLGHQCLVEAFGGRTARAKFPLHGEASAVTHQGHPLFDNIPSPFMAGRYHSLISVPAAESPLQPIARSDDGELMAVAHNTAPWFGVQFHPESLLTEHGARLIRNFVHHCKER